MAKDLEVPEVKRIREHLDEDSRIGQEMARLGLRIRSILVRRAASIFFRWDVRKHSVLKKGISTSKPLRPSRSRGVTFTWIEG